MKLEQAGYGYFETIYYISVGCTMAFSLYIIVIATIAVMNAQRMSLHGNIDQAHLVLSRWRNAESPTPAKQPNA